MKNLNECEILMKRPLLSNSLSLPTLSLCSHHCPPPLRLLTVKIVYFTMKICGKKYQKKNHPRSLSPPCWAELVDGCIEIYWFISKKLLHNRVEPIRSMKLVRNLFKLKQIEARPNHCCDELRCSLFSMRLNL